MGDYKEGDIVEWCGERFLILELMNHYNKNIAQVMYIGDGTGDSPWVPNEIIEKFNLDLDIAGEFAIVVERESDSLSELEYLRMFYNACDFGLAHDVVIYIINENIKEETGKKLPESYCKEEDDE